MTRGVGMGGFMLGHGVLVKSIERVSPKVMDSDMRALLKWLR